MVALSGGGQHCVVLQRSLWHKAADCIAQASFPQRTVVLKADSPAAWRDGIGELFHLFLYIIGWKCFMVYCNTLSLNAPQRYNIFPMNANFLFREHYKNKKTVTLSPLVLAFFGERATVVAE